MWEVGFCAKNFHAILISDGADGSGNTDNTDHGADEFERIRRR